MVSNFCTSRKSLQKFDFAEVRGYSSQSFLSRAVMVNIDRDAGSVDIHTRLVHVYNYYYYDKYTTIVC